MIRDLEAAIDVFGREISRFMSDDRAEFLKAYYRLLTDDIRRSEAIIPQVCGLEIAVMAYLFYVRFAHGPLYFATILAILTSTWTMHLLINANFWARRSGLMAANVERTFLSASDMDILLPRAYYSDARIYRYRRVFRAPFVLSAAFFVISLAAASLTTNRQSFSIIFLSVLLLWSVYVENRNCAREYAYLVDHAPGNPL
jgi:hypothetical protein